MRSMQHDVELIEGYSVAGLWSGLCSCGRQIGDGPREEVERQAREHEEGIEQPWVIPRGEHREWDPSKHPIPE